MTEKETWQSVGDLAKLALTFPQSRKIQDVCIWLLLVMDENDRSRRFVTSVYLYFLERGAITDAQMAALKRIASGILADIDRGILECQGGRPAPYHVIEVFDNVVSVDFVGDNKK